MSKVSEISEIYDWFMTVIWIMLGFVVGGGLAAAAGKSTLEDFRQDAVEQGVAEYNSETGDWQWAPRE